MNISNSEKVNDFLTDIQFKSPEQCEIIISIRELFFESDKNIVDDIKYGGVVFNLSNTLVGGIYSYKEHLSIEFSHGAEFTDVDSVLEGGGKKRRHLKIITKDEIVNKNCRYFIDQATRE